MAKEFRLTTFDNPFDPFEQFTLWFKWDVAKGYHSCEYLARIAKLSDDMTAKEEREAEEKAIDEIILYDPFNVYKKVSREIVENNSESGNV